MKLKAFLAALLVSSTALAGNTITQVTQVTSGVTLTTDVDYVVTSTTPFATAGSVDIQNTEHAVLIFKNIRPSKVISQLMGNIFINGEPAKNDVNCQVKIYAQGAIVMPYSRTIKPLTCYTEQNFGGESYNTYSLNSSGGFMNTLTAKQLNNQIRSFKLKRGYMVTFAVGTGGWGYSRCFIADNEDLELATLPHVLDGRISSYRIFKWCNFDKKAIANDTRYEPTQALKVTGCYSFGKGENRYPDTECIPHHIYEDWPSASECGGVTYSCHMKTNNEPGNSADDHPQSVDDVLANWQNLMRTGMRLCSESSHDGSWSHLKSFMDSIDARGWRCDILDLHCYWSGGFDNLNWYSDNYGKGRPIWISEWIWGASWNKNGCFGSGVTNDQILNTTKNILTTLNNNPRVERYFYWNSESKGHIYENGKATSLGQYYADMETGLGYNKKYEYIPKVVYKAPYGISATYNKVKKQATIVWRDPNGDMLDSIIVECKLPNTTKWVKCGNVDPKDKTSGEDIAYTFNDNISDPGIYYYRATEYYEGKKFTTGETTVTISAANAVGSLQYGELKIANTESVTTDIATQDEAPYVVMGMVSNKNAGNGITNQIQSLGKTSFKFRFYPWQLTTPVAFNATETVNYLILPPDTVYHLSDDMMIISQKAGSIKGDEVEVTFPEAFPAGVTPVVVAQQNTSIATYPPVTVKVYGVSNTGFKVKLVRQEGVTTTFSAQNVNYFAATPGQIAIGGGKLLTVGLDKETPVGGVARQTVTFRNEAGDSLFFINPVIIAASQTDNYDKASVFRMHSTVDEGKGVHSASIRRQVDGTSTSTTTNNAKANGDYIGWFIISDDPNGTGDEEPIIVPTGIEGVKKNLGFSVSVLNHAIYAEGKGLKVYSTSGAQVRMGQPLPAGVYIVTNGKQHMKVRVK